LAWEKFLRKLAKSCFVVALVAFATLNICFDVSDVFRFDKYLAPIHGPAWWVVERLRRANKNFEVAFFGSSLVVYALNGADANFLRQTIDETEHHWSVFTDHGLSTISGGRFRTFDFAFGGQIPSDACLMLKEALALGCHPQVALYGIGPRDFLDPGAEDPTSTDCYKYLERLVDTRDVDRVLALPRVTEWRKSLLNSVYLNRHAVDFQSTISEKVGSVEAKYLSAFPDRGLQGFCQRKELLPNYKLGDRFPGVYLIDPLPPELKQRGYRELAIYEKVYRHDSRKIEAMQMRSLAEFVDLCKANGINCVLLNMPLSPSNIDLYGKERYARFVQSLNELAVSRSAGFVDLAHEGTWERELFVDSVHLNPVGGTKVVEMLVPKLTRYMNVAVARSESAPKKFVATD
jgi:hypothetical protein